MRPLKIAIIVVVSIGVIYLAMVGLGQLLGLSNEGGPNEYDEAEKNKISIGTAEQFLAMEKDKGYILTNDIELSADHPAVTAPLVLDGANHVVSGISRPLFSGGASQARIHDIKFNADITGLHIGILSDNNKFGIGYKLNNVELSGKLTTQGTEVCGSIAPIFNGALENVTIDTNISGAAPAGGFGGEVKSFKIKDSKFIGTIQSDRGAYGFAKLGWAHFENSTISGTIESKGAASGFTHTCNLYRQEWNLNGLSIKDCAITGNSLVGGLFSHIGEKLGEDEYLPDSSSIGGVSMQNVTVSGNRYVGGLFGACDSSLATRGAFESQSGVTVKGLAGSTYSEMDIGGIVGHYTKGNANGWTNRATVINEGTGSRVGGITGYSSANFSNCNNYGTVTSAGDSVGGIVGYYYADSSGTAISNCVNHANVSGVNKVGGIVGGSGKYWTVVDMTIKDCTNLAIISGTTKVQQIYGQNESYIKLVNCSLEGSVVTP